MQILSLSLQKANYGFWNTRYSRILIMEQSIHEILKRYWGYDSFRPLQEDIIQSVLKGKDTLALMPTGGGKSITYQVPGLYMDGICIVVTPLIALMKDQVDTLRALDIKASYIHSGMSRREMLITLDNCIFGKYKFLYVSPERLSTTFPRKTQRFTGFTTCCRRGPLYFAVGIWFPPRLFKNSGIATDNSPNTRTCRNSNRNSRSCKRYSD